MSQNHSQSHSKSHKLKLKRANTVTEGSSKCFSSCWLFEMRKIVSSCVLCVSARTVEERNQRMARVASDRVQNSVVFVFQKLVDVEFA